jgi:hypothetical protein
MESFGQDSDQEKALKALRRIWLQQEQQKTSDPPPKADNPSPAKSPSKIYPLPPQLKTEKSDYTELRDLLAAGNWKEADRETATVMLKVASREKEGWLGEEDIDRFPCEDLKIIDRLWVHYSKGKFGFSVQKEIYQSLGGTREYNNQIWYQFCETVGWRVNNEWIYYSDMTFSLEAPPGHLPVGWGRLLFDGGVVRLFSRVQTCRL